jgi:hypothetical protein
VQVQILLHGQPTPISRSSQFYGKTFEALREDGHFDECLKSYLKSHHQTAMPTNDAEFRQMLSQAHQRFEYELLDAGVEINRLTAVEEGGQGGSAGQPLEKPGLFFWLEDDEAAVFLFALTTDKTRGLAFRTRDAALLKIFGSTFEEYWNASRSIRKGTLTAA